MSETGIDLASLAPPEIQLGEPESASAPAEAPEVQEQETTAPDGSESQEQGQEAQPRTPGDLNKRVSDFLKGLKEEGNGDILKALRDSYFTHNRYREIYPSVDDALSLKQQFEGFGGAEGITEMQDVISSVEHTDELLESGDPEVIDQIFEDAKEGAIKLAPHYLARVQRESPEAFQRAILPHAVAMLDGSNLPGFLETLDSLITENPQAKGMVRQLARWYEEQKQLANGFKTDTISPDRSKLSEERQALMQERQQIFMEGIQQDVVGKINQSLASRMEPYRAALAALPERVRQDFAKSAYAEIASLADADRQFQAAINGMIGSRKRDRSSVVNFIGAKVDSVADRIVSKLAQEYGLKKGHPGARTRQADRSNGAGNGGSKGSPSAPVKLAGKPDFEAIDWDKTAEEAQKHGMSTNVFYMNHNAWLKNGNFARW